LTEFETWLNWNVKLSEFNRIMNSLHCQNSLKLGEFAEQIDNKMEQI